MTNAPAGGGRPLLHAPPHARPYRQERGDRQGPRLQRDAGLRDHARRQGAKDKGTDVNLTAMTRDEVDMLESRMLKDPDSGSVSIFIFRQ